MSQCRSNAVIDAPLEVVWRLVGDADRHPDWWPRVLEVDCEDFSQGCTYRQVTRGAFGDRREDTIMVDRLEAFHEVKVRCLETGTYMVWVMTEVRGDTFIEAEFGCDPATSAIRAFDVMAGKRFFRRWMEQAVEGLRAAAGREREGAAPR